MSVPERLAQAWALKEQCFSVWNREPASAAAAADALRQLCATAETPATPQDHEIEALADWTEGIAEITRGHMSGAANCFDRAAAAFRGLGQPLNAAQTQVPKIMVLSTQGRHVEAAACAERTLRELRALGDVRGAGKVSLNLGSLNIARDAYPEAARHYREAAVLFARVGDHEHSVMADYGLADALTAMGDFDEALHYYERTRLRASRHGLHKLGAMVAEAVALLDLARGRYREALAGMETARCEYERLAMPQSVAFAEKQLGDAYLELRLLAEALSLFDLALAKFEALDLPDDRAWALSQRGRALALLGRRAEATLSFAAAAELFAALGNPVGEAAIALARAELALDDGQGVAALALTEQAATAFDAADRADGRARADLLRAECLMQTGQLEAAQQQFDATLQRALELQLLAVQVRCRTGQGRLAQARGDEVAARAAFDTAIEAFEDQRRALPGDEIRSAFLDDHLLPYQGLLRLALTAHQRDASPQTAAAVLHHLDGIRARTLSERLLEAPVDTDDDAVTQVLRTRLNWLYRRTQRLDDEAEPSAALNDERQCAERELLERARRQRLAAPSRSAETPAADDGFSLTALQAALADDDALVEYGVLDGELFACVVNRRGVQVQRRLASWPDVQETLRAARFQIETLRHGSAPVLRHLPSLTARALQRMQRLHALVWAPLAAMLSTTRRVLVVPHGPLGSLPFGALHDGERTVAQRHALALAPSARLALRGLQRQPVPARQVLALGESSRLPQAASEARFVAGLFGQGQVFVDAEASVATLQAHAAAADVIHLACHAEFRADNPMFSALHLADAALTVDSAERLTLRPGTVVLSACETGLAENSRGDEMFGLVRAFLVAGAARVVASLWPVDDRVTAAFMAHFYSALQRGDAPALALQQAQNLSARDHPHPFYWAAFTLYGGF